ncbi:hypothetical protein X777_00904 [Ooceraea biroi]|uniref:Uncharacterized protein n=1 Tax=Ooceraea biroi TaxID=2015173 RepID=A0A026WP17_OOCBI|nr:hypothetical protein X777_00904 [Ooceraea biroi]
MCAFTRYACDEIRPSGTSEWTRIFPRFPLVIAGTLDIMTQKDARNTSGRPALAV